MRLVCVSMFITHTHGRGYMPVTLQSPELHDHLGLDYAQPPKAIAKRMEKDLKLVGLEGLADKNPALALPRIEGLSLERLEQEVAGYEAKHFRRLARLATVPVPKRPAKLPPITGQWHQYDVQRVEWDVCPPPSNATLVLDFETVKRSMEPRDTAPELPWQPVTCWVWSPELGWLVWSQRPSFQAPLVAPMGGGNTIVGWNVSYDRSFLDIEYLREDSGNRFFDGMSAWIFCRGMSNQQRPLMLAARKTKDVVVYTGDREDGGFTEDNQGEIRRTDTEENYQLIQRKANPHLSALYPWIDDTETNGLDRVHRFYTGEALDKGVRDSIVNGGELCTAGMERPVSGFEWVKYNMGEVLRYCAGDIVATLQVFQYVYPEWLEHHPDAISRIARLKLGSVWVPLSAKRWPTFYERTEKQFRSEQKVVADQLMTAAYALYQKHERGLEAIAKSKTWEIDLAGFVAGLTAQERSLDWQPARAGKNKGKPKWLRDIKQAKLTQRWVPVVLGLTYAGERLWWDGERADGGSWMYGTKKVPHPDNPPKRVTTVFAKGFKTAVKSGLLAGSDHAKEMLGQYISHAQWVAFRKRVAGIKTEAPEGYPVAVPNGFKVEGTVSGRCADPFFQVMPNAKEGRLGSEVKAMVEAPAGYVIVGADMDQQEALAAALGGDIRGGYGFTGGSPFSSSVIAGEKSAKTDFHSVNAAQTGLSRSDAKPAAFASLYGSGAKGLTVTIMKLKGCSEPEAEAIATTFLATFKGVKDRYQGELTGGLASASFNFMLTEANAAWPETPILKNKLSKALAGVEDFVTTRQNWVIQASGSDLRDCLVTFSSYFFKRFGVAAKLILTCHDEIRFLVPKEQAILATVAMQYVSLYTQALTVRNMGLVGLAAGASYFSAVDIDSVWRKEPSMSCRTPSNDEPIPAMWTVSLKPRKPA